MAIERIVVNQRLASTGLLTEGYVLADTSFSQHPITGPTGMTDNGSWKNIPGDSDWYIDFEYPYVLSENFEASIWEIDEDGLLINGSYDDSANLINPYRFRIIINSGPRYAHDDIDFSGVPSDGEEALLNGVIYKWVDTLVGESDAVVMLIGADEFECALTFKNAINADYFTNNVTWIRFDDINSFSQDPTFGALLEDSGDGLDRVVLYSRLLGGIGHYISTASINDNWTNVSVGDGSLGSSEELHSYTYYDVAGVIEEDETITINETVYTVKDTPTDPFEITSGDEDTFVINMVAAINGTDGINDPNPDVVAYINNLNQCLIIARTSSSEADAWVTTTTAANGSFSEGALTMLNNGNDYEDTRYTGLAIFNA